MNFEIPANPSEEDFQNIAKELINQYVLKVNKAEILFCDLEFYWFDKENLPDKSTHSHQYENSGLRPHSSGFDITLQDGDKYGGILIRGIIAGNTTVYGPLRSASKILEFGGNLLKGKLEVNLEKNPNPSSSEIFKTTRIRLGKKAEGFADKKYRFTKCDSLYLKKVDRREKLCRAMVAANKLDQQIAIEKVLGYTPKILEAMMSRFKKAVDFLVFQELFYIWKI